MKNNLSPFQIILFAVLIISIVAGVLVFSLRRADQRDNVQEVTAWGTLPEENIIYLVQEINKIKRDSLKLQYRQFIPTEFEAAFIEALAAGTGPDILFLNSDLIVRHENKLYPIPYDAYSQRNFKDTFIEAGDVLLRNDGIIGLPYIIDPLVLYWNRSILNSVGISTPPVFWDQLMQMAPRITKKDDNFNIQRSSIALGEFRNINHARQILLAMILQAGNPVIVRNTNSNNPALFIVTLNDNLDFAVKPAETTLSFYTQFSNPASEMYSWNRSLPISKEMFLAGDLAFYVGFASEFSDIQRQNPNLNFDVAVIPQSRNNENTKSTIGNMVFMGIARNSNNVQSAFGAILKLTNRENIYLLTEIAKLPPVRRDLLVEKKDNAVLQTFYESALFSKVFFEPGTQSTNMILADMVETYTSGRSTLTQSLLRADMQLKDLFK